jgi:hypothetical protein
MKKLNLIFLSAFVAILGFSSCVDDETSADDNLVTFINATGSTIKSITVNAGNFTIAVPATLPNGDNFTDSVNFPIGTAVGSEAVLSGNYVYELLKPGTQILSGTDTTIEFSGIVIPYGDEDTKDEYTVTFGATELTIQ